MLLGAVLVETLYILQVFAKEVMEKVLELNAEKMKTEKALHDFLPTTVLRGLKKRKARNKLMPLFYTYI